MEPAVSPRHGSQGPVQTTGRASSFAAQRRRMPSLLRLACPGSGWTARARRHGAAAQRRPSLVLPRAMVASVPSESIASRKGRYMRTLFTELKEAPDGLAAKDAIEAVRSKVA